MVLCVFKLWSMLDGALLKICSRDTKDSMDSFHGGWVTDLHFSPDDAVLVSTGGYVKVHTLYRCDCCLQANHSGFIRHHDFFRFVF